MRSSLAFESQLKLYLLAHGVRIDPEAERAWEVRFKGPVSLSEYASTSGICVYTTSGVYVNAPFVEEFTQESEAHFVFTGEDFAIDWHGARVPVSVIPVPGFHHTTYSDNGTDYPYTDRCRISPIEGCGWICKFCNLPYEMRYRKKSKDALLRVVQLAERDELSPARHVLISGGTPKPEDEAWIDEIYAFIAGNSPISVDVMMPARNDFGYPAWLRSVGVNMVSLNIEIWDPARARRIMPQKFRLGRDHYLRYIEAAVHAFGAGFVQSLILVGRAVEPIESTLEGVQALVDRGCIPVLSPFRPDPRTPMEREAPASIEEMSHVYEATLEICERAGTGIKPGPRCIPCQHNTIAFPDGSDFYIPLGGDLTKR